MHAQFNNQLELKQKLAISCTLDRKFTIGREQHLQPEKFTTR
jgi:hypothetical protein